MANHMDQRFFCGIGFSISITPYQMMAYMSKDHVSWVTNDGNHVMVPNLIEMISTIAPMTRTNARVLEP